VFRRCRAEDRGFTIIEVMVAVLLLAIGLLAAVSLVDAANRGTSTNDGRAGATNLARRVLEAAHLVPYASLTPTGSAAAIQSIAPDLATSGSGWTVRRQGFRYTLTLNECAVDDPADGLGVHTDSSLFCSDSTGTGTADSAPQDYKRLSLSVQWPGAGRTQTVKEAAIVGPSND